MVDTSAAWIRLGLWSAVAVVTVEAQAQGRNRVEGVELSGNGETRTVRIRTAEEPTFTVFRLSNPMRVVIDISAGDVSSLAAPILVEDGVLGQIGAQQFSADGFFIGRLIVGFEKDLTYDVQAEGRSVVIRTGGAPGSGVERALPPPVAPVDRAAAERFEAARKDAEAAAGKAAQERKHAENMAAQAKEQQAEAQRLAKEAERVRKEAEAARSEAEALRNRAQEAIARDRAAAEEAARQAEDRLRDLQVSAQAIAASRAEAERLAAQAEQARRDAEETAARAEAQHKVRLAELEEQTARAQKEKRAAEAARERADAARRDAEQAQEAAEQARQEAERSRALTAAKLTEIAERERQARAAHDKLQGERQAIETKRQQVEAQQAAVESERQEMETRRQKLESDEQGLAASRRDMESRRRALDARSQGIDAKEQQVETERKRLADMQKSIEATQERLAKEREQIAALKKRVEAASSKAAPKAKAEAKAPPVVAAADSKPVPVEALVASPSHKVKVASTAAAVPSTTTEKSAVAGARLVGIKRRGSGAQAAVLLAIEGSPPYEVQRLEDPPRLVIDLADTVRAVSRTTYGVKSPFVTRVRLGDHGSVVRAVIDLTAAASEHDVQTTPEGLLVRMQAPPPAVASTKVAPASEPKTAMNPPAPAKPMVPAPPAGEQSTLRDVRFKGTGATARVILDIAQAPIARVDDRSRRAWVLELRGARIPKDLERSLDTSAYGTVVRLVSSYQASTDPPIVNVVANLEGPASYDLRRESGTLVWEIRASSAAATVAASSFTTEASALAGSAAPQQGKPRKRISIDLKDADIVNVIRLIAEEADENIITSDDVSGKVTLKLRNVPWDQALDTILKSKGYGTVREHNIMRIAPLERIQRERELQLARKKAEEQVEEPTIKMITVNYATASDLVARLKPILSGRGSIEVDTRTNTLIVDDIRHNVNRIVELTRRLDKQTPQVLIEARIVEATSSNLRDLGVQWGGVGQATARAGNPTGLQFPGDVRASGAADDPVNSPAFTVGTGSPGQYAVNLPAPIGPGGGGGLGFIFGSADGSQILNLRLSALEDAGKGRIISSPRITTLDNRTAKISQGIDIPITVVSAAGANTRFIPANLELEVTPHVTNDGSVLMKIKTEKSEPDFGRTGAQGDPTIVKKFAETEVLVRDGDTTVIGGIYTRTTSERYRKVPLFAEIPILGWFFKRKTTVDDRAELLVFITPRIVNREESVVQSTPSPGGVTP